MDRKKIDLDFDFQDQIFYFLREFFTFYEKKCLS